MRWPLVFFFLCWYFQFELRLDCELFAFIFVYDNHFSALFYTVNFMVCALILRLLVFCVHVYLWFPFWAPFFVCDSMFTLWILYFLWLYRCMDISICTSLLPLVFCVHVYLWFPFWAPFFVCDSQFRLWILYFLWLYRWVDFSICTSLLPFLLKFVLFPSPWMSNVRNDDHITAINILNKSWDGFFCDLVVFR